MTTETQTRRQFASDNYAGICPEAFAAMAEANQGHEVSYGNDTWTDKASNLSGKGIDTSAMTSLIQDAKTQIIAPLQSAIESATDGKSLADALHKYCLFDGCKDGTNFHFAAKWEIAKLSAMENYVKAQPKAANYTTQLDKVTSDLNSANAGLSAVGSSQYDDHQSTVWDPIKDAAETLKQVIHGMRS